MSGVPQQRHGQGTLFQLGDGTPTANVVVGTGGAAQGATTVPVAALTVALAAGDLLLFGRGKHAELTAPALVAATSLTVKPLVTALVAGDSAIGGESFATIAEYYDMTPPNPTRGTFETTHYLSEQMERGSGMIDPGTSSISFNLLPNDPTQDDLTGLEAAFNDGKLHNFRIIWPQYTPAVVRTFAARVTSFPITSPIGDRMTGSCELAISGRVRRY